MSKEIQTPLDAPGTVTAADILAVQNGTAPPPTPEAPAEPVAPAQPQEFRAELPTGQVYTGKTQEELLQQLIQAQTNASQAINRFKEENALLRMQANAKPAATTPQPSSATFDPAQYWQLQATNPLEAYDYLNQHYYGIENPRAALEESYKAAQVVQQTHAVNEFKARNPDYPQTPEAGDLIAARHALTFGQKAPITPESLEVAYRSLVNQGVLRPVQHVVPPTESRGAGAPPSGPSGGGTPPAQPFDESLYEGLSTQQLEQLLVRKGVLRR